MCEHAEKNQALINRRQTTVVILGALAGIGPLCTDLYLPALPQVAEFFRAGASQVQLSLTASLIGIAAGQVFIGPISDVRGRRIPLLASLVVFVAASFLCAGATSSNAFTFFRFVQGFSGAGGVVLSRAVACDYYQGPALTKFFSVLMLINGIAPIFSPVIGAQILKVADWTGIFIFLGVCGAALLGAVLLGLEESLPEQRRNPGGMRATFQVFGVLFSNARYMKYAMIHSFVIAGLFGYIAASPFVLQTIYGLSAEVFSFYFAANGIGIMIAAQVAGRLSESHGEKKILKFGLMLSFFSSLTILAVCVFDAAGIWWMAVPLFVVISCVGITTTTSFSLAIQYQRGNAGSASGMIGVLSFLFGAIASPMVGLGGGKSALPMAVVLFAASLLALLGEYMCRGENHVEEDLTHRL